MRRILPSLLFCLGLIFCPVHGNVWARPVYNVGIRPISPPFSFLALQDGEKRARGYSVDEMSLLGRIMGADIRFRAVHDLSKRRDMFRTGTLDILAHDSERSAREMDAFWIPVGVSIRSHLYVNKDCRSVTCLRDLEDRKVAGIISGPYSDGIVLDDDTIWLASPLEALTMVSQGVVDVFVAPSERVADDLIERNRIPNIIKKGVPLGETPLGMIVTKARPELAERLEKAFVHLQETGMDAQLHDKWFGKPTISEDIRIYTKYVAVGSGVLGIVFVIVVVWNRSLKRRVARMTMDLRRTEQRYRDLIESSPDMIFLVDEKGDILHANERVWTNLGVPDQPEPLNLRQVVVGEYGDEAIAFLTKIFHDGCSKFDLVMRGASGQPMEVEVAGRIIQGAAREQLLACLFARDVTERNRMEKELLQSERLGIIGKMAASLAHEINNPLGVIQANAEDLVFEEGLSPDVKEGLGAIQRNAIRAGEITKGLLETATPKPMSMEVLEVESLVRDSLSLLGSKGKRQRVVVQVDGGPLYLRGDERALQQILMNLVFNSLAASSEHAPIHILAHREGAGPDETVRIEVRDTGKGIERAKLTQIFEPFFSSRKGGFGLGLFITRRMVERMHGLIFAESEAGKGTSMYLEFPSVRPEGG